MNENEKKNHINSPPELVQYVGGDFEEVGKRVYAVFY